MADYEYPITEPPQVIYRVSRGQIPTELRPIDTYPPDDRWPGRFDDDYSKYRVLYAGTSKEAAYRETLQDFKPSSPLLDALLAIDTDAPELNDPDPREYVGALPVSWMTSRSIGTIEVIKPCPCVAITDSDTIAKLRVKLGLDITVADLLSDNRLLTQRLSRLFYNHGDRYFGISYSSKLGTNLSNFAFFESLSEPGSLRARLVPVSAEDISVDDPVFVDVANSLGLTLPGYAAVNAVARLYPDIAPAYVHVADALERYVEAHDDIHLAGTGMLDNSHVFSVRNKIDQSALIVSSATTVDVMAKGIGDMHSYTPIWTSDIGCDEDIERMLLALDDVFSHYERVLAGGK
jgi:RES domain